MKTPPDSALADAQGIIAALRSQLAERTAERDEAVTQQTATTEVLQVINSSPGDLAPVFDAILEKAHNLCGSGHGTLLLRDGDHFRAAAMRGVPESFAERFGQVGLDAPAVVPLLAGEPFVHITDVTAADHPLARAGFAVGVRALLSVPLRKGDALIGLIVAARFEAQPFTDKQIALLQNFAAQAVIAMENARLITETREALEQQTATAEVLGVINSSPGDLAPVFDAMLEKALRLCDAAWGIINTYDGELFHLVAMRSPPALADTFKSAPNLPRASRHSGLRRIVLGENVVHIEDLAADPVYQEGEARRVIEAAGAHSYLGVALRHEGKLLGTIGTYRQEVRPFSQQQIALLQNFAAQAVIAMENARLLTETREALEQQTATGEILRVVSGSQSDVQPVFEAIVESASKLCEAEVSAVARYDGTRLDLVAINNMSPEEAAAFHSLFPRVPLPSFVMGRAVIEHRSVNIEDVLSEPGYDARTRETLVDPWEYRSFLGVPILREGEPIGVIGCGRREVKPFTAKQIELVETFAAQAVIAIENTRLITETRDALEQQTATAEVLGVINSSPGDLAPVFDAMLDKAMRLCEAVFGTLWTLEADRFRPVAHRGVPARYAEHLDAAAVGPAGTLPRTSLAGRAFHGESFAQVVDLVDEELYRAGDPDRRALVDLGGARTGLAIPLRKDKAVVGVILIYRQEIRPFSDKQIALLQNFAAQAVIAMENARLLEEIRQRQAELRVTFDNMADGVVMFDEALHLAAWNRNFQELLDLPDALLAERPSYTDYLRILAERGEFGTDDIVVEAELSRRLESTDQELRTERTRPDGRVIEVRRNAVPDGGFVLIYSDITERKRSEAEIRAARDTAEATLRDLRAAQSSLVQAQKMAALGQLTAGIAHEIKNPLNFVNNFAGLSVELLEELKETAAPAITVLDEDKRADIDETIELLTGNLKKIAEHGHRADNIVKSMLEHSRGVSGERREVDLNNLIDEALNLAYHGARAQDRSFNIGLEHDYAPMLKPIELVPQEITRVLLNLFGNGFYAAHKRAQQTTDAAFQPLLTVTTHDLGKVVEVRIRDNGIGIPAEIKDKLFQPFFTTKPTGEGTGLGLSISYDIVTQQHGGTIEVDSEVGQFAEFTVRLPRQ
jgi:two-component system, NtrC family, sensor kinase